VIPKVRPEDAGLYRCEAKSVTGDDANMTARVTVISDTRPENSKFTFGHSQFSFALQLFTVGGTGLIVLYIHCHSHFPNPTALYMVQ
jgi:hypothetical protein